VLASAKLGQGVPISTEQRKSQLVRKVAAGATRRGLPVEPPPMLAGWDWNMTVYLEPMIIFSIPLFAG